MANLPPKQLLAWLIFFCSPCIVIAEPTKIILATDLIQHVVIEPATKDTPRSDTASIAQLPDNQLMVVYHKYESGERSGHDHGICRIWSKVSDDYGKTWHHPRMLVDVAKGDMNVQAPALLHTKAGNLLLISLRAHPEGNSSTMCLFASVDGGKTFCPAIHCGVDQTASSSREGRVASSNSNRDDCSFLTTAALATSGGKRTALGVSTATTVAGVGNDRTRSNEPRGKYWVFLPDE